MMKYKKWWLVALGISLVLTGCQPGQKAQKEVAMGRYLEESLCFQGEDDSVQSYQRVYFENLKGEAEAIEQDFAREKDIFRCWQKDQDGTWKQADTALSNALNQSGLTAVTAVEKDKTLNKIYVIGFKYNAAQNSMGEPMGMPCILEMKEGAVLQEISTEFNKEVPTKFIVHISNGKMITLDTEGDSLKEYDIESGRKIREMAEDVKDFVVLQDKLYLLKNGKNTLLQCYDIASGEKENESQLPDEIRLSNMVAAEDQKGVYLVSQSGIYYLQQVGQIPEKVLDGNLCNLPQYSRPQLCQGIFYIDQLQYVYHQELPTVPDRKVTIVTVEDNYSLKQLVARYRKENPESSIEYITMAPYVGESDKTNAQRNSEAVQKLNTQIMTGAVPDILLLDDLPVDTYIEKNVLGDISELITETEKDNSYYEQLINAYEKEGKIYAVPLGFKIFKAVGEKTFLKEGFDLSKLAAYQRQHPDEQAVQFSEMETGELVKLMSSFYKDKLIHENGSVDQKTMKAFLEDIKAVLPSQDPNACNYEGEPVIIAAQKKQLKAALKEISTAQDLQELFYAREQMRDGMITSHIAGKDACLQPIQIMGLSIKGTKNEEAKKFMQYALTQKRFNNKDLYFFYGLSVEKKENTTYLSGQQKDYNDMMEKDEGVILPTIKDGILTNVYLHDWYTEETETYLKQLEQEQVIRPVNEKVAEIIQQEAASYFEGSTTSQQAAEAIKEKIDLYLSEQNLK